MSDEHHDCQCPKCKGSCEVQETFAQSAMRLNDQSNQLAITNMVNHQMQMAAQWRSVLEDERNERMARLKLFLSE